MQKGIAFTVSPTVGHRLRAVIADRNAPQKHVMRRARVFGDHPPRDKEHHLASRKCRRESTPQTIIARPSRARENNKYGQRG
jgi:hypothetical protein